MKKVISACVDQILQFDSEQEVDRYVEQLSGKKQLFQIVWKNTLDNGIVQIRVKKQYNNTDFMKENAGAVDRFIELLRAEIHSILKDNYAEKRERIQKLEDENRFVGLDLIIRYCDGKIHGLERIIKFVDRFQMKGGETDAEE